MAHDDGADSTNHRHRIGGQSYGDQRFGYWLDEFFERRTKMLKHVLLPSR